MENENVLARENQYKGKGAFDAFLNLLSLITLGWMSLAVGAALFQIINKFLAAPAVDYVAYFSQSGLKFSLASAMIITPIFLAVVSWLHRNYKTGNLNCQSGIHRWLTYLMLLISALTVIGRLVYQLFRFLDGDYALAVILKTLVILIIAGGIFGYYFYDLMRKDFTKKSPVSLAVFIVVVVIALGAVSGGFFIIDSPAQARALKFDNQRANDLANLNYIIDNYYQQNKKLPVDLSLPQFSNRQDPETGQSYEYQALDVDKYELCAVFSLPVPADPNSFPEKPMADADIYTHGAGRQCFSRTVEIINQKNINRLNLD